MRNFLGVIIVFVLSCCNNSKYENYHSFENSIWHTDSIVKFKYIVTDTTKKYNINLKIRHTVDYQFQNLFVFVETDKIDTVEVFLAKKNGEWLGRGISDIRELTYILEKEREFYKKGEYKIYVEQAMRHGSKKRIENLQHILNLGITVKEHNE